MRASSRRWLIAAAALAAIAFPLAHFYPLLFLRNPPVWPDEGLFANPAINWLRHGRLATTLIGNLLPGMEVRTYWCPPVYFVLLTGVFKVFGIGIIQMRAFSTALGVLAVAVLWLLSRQITRSAWIPWVVALLVSLDQVFLRAATIGRMDILTLLFVYTSLLLYLRYLASGRQITALACGLAAGLALATHPMGLSAGAAIGVHLLWRRRKGQGKKADYLAALGFVAALLPWAIYIAQDASSFWAQFAGQMARKGARNPLTASYWHQLRFLTLRQYATAEISAGAFFALAAIGLIRGRRRLSPVALNAGFTVLLLMSAGEAWYVVFLVPSAVLGVSVLLEEGILRRPGRIALVLALVSAGISAWFLYANLGATERLARTYRKAERQTDYLAWCQEISRRMPAGSKVFLASIPDPYLGLSARQDLQFYHFVPSGVPVDLGAYRRRFSDMDYIVFSREQLSNEAALFVHYHAKLVATVGSAKEFGYFVRIYQVVHKKQRLPF